MQSPVAVATLMRIANRRLRAGRIEDHGQDLLEYGLLVALISTRSLR